MKKIFILTLVLMLSSCFLGEPNLSGKWKKISGYSGNHIMEIFKTGDTYKITVITSSFSFPGYGNFAGKYDEGVIRIQSKCGNIRYSEEDKNIHYCDAVFSKFE